MVMVNKSKGLIFQGVVGAGIVCCCSCLLRVGQEAGQDESHGQDEDPASTSAQAAGCRGMRLGAPVVGILLVLVLVLRRRLVVHIRVGVLALVALEVAAVGRQAAAAAAEDAQRRAGQSDAAADASVASTAAAAADAAITASTAAGRTAGAGRSAAAVERQLAKDEGRIVGVHRLQAVHGVAGVEDAAWMIRLGELLERGRRRGRVVREDGHVRYDGHVVFRPEHVVRIDDARRGGARGPRIAALVAIIPVSGVPVPVPISVSVHPTIVVMATLLMAVVRVGVKRGVR